MTVRAKFKVESVESNGADGGTVKLTPVMSGSPENESFFKFTPWGSIEIGTINMAALAQFERGAEFYVDFIRADNA